MTFVFFFFLIVLAETPSPMLNGSREGQRPCLLYLILEENLQLFTVDVILAVDFIQRLLISAC